MIEKSAPMDKLAYGGNFATLVEMAKNEKEPVCLFDGKYNNMFAPTVVKDNIDLMNKGDKNNVTPLLQEDTQTFGKKRVAKVSTKSVGKGIDDTIRKMEVENNKRISDAVDEITDSMFNFDDGPEKIDKKSQSSKLNKRPIPDLDAVKYDDNDDESSMKNSKY